MNKEKIREERIFEIVERAELNCTICASQMGRLAVAS